MRTNIGFILTAVLFLALAEKFVFAQNKKNACDRFVTYIVDIKKQELKLYWKNDANENFKSIENLKLWVEKKNKISLHLKQ